MEDREIKSLDDVEKFLKQFFAKLDIWGIFFLNREKNQNALSSLGIVPQAREKYIREICGEDYVETITSAMAFGEMWVFGRGINGREVYIKISLGNPGNKTICISFHEAENPVRYAFKKRRGKDEN